MTREEKPLLLLFDGNALVHRAFHALPPLTQPKTGELVNAVYGFASTLLISLLAQGAQDIVSLEAVNFKNGNMKGFYQLVNLFYLAFQFLRRGRALGFVFLEHLMPEGRGGTVKGHSPMSGLKISKYFEQGTGKAIDSTYQLPGFGLG